jgi:hypothetical protein
VDNSNPRASALKALAEHVRERAASGVSIVVAGPRRLTPTEEKDRQQSAECLAAELDNLAETIDQNTLTFENTCPRYSLSCIPWESLQIIYSSAR